MEKCPCCSQQDYINCCGKYIEGGEKAPTAEALMRSRYTAHVKVNIDYIINTVHPNHRDKSNPETIRSWAEQAEWTRLEVLKTEQGTEGDLTGRVLFKAHYKYQQQLKTHFEDSFFVKENGCWYFVEGKEPVVAAAQGSTKIGRNDPCYCGSGRKFKKCCAKK